jgi:ComEC/Rec2-related protein
LYTNRALFELGDSGGLLISLLSGNKDFLEDGVAQKFKDTGLSHILALSGMHLSLFSYIAIQIGSTLGGKKVSVRCSLFAMLFFLWFAGESPSLIRAFFLSVLGIFSVRSGYSCKVLKLLSLTFLLQLITRPMDIKSIGGILSYLALIGIMYFTDKPQKVCNSYIPQVFSSSLLATIGALCATASFQILTFAVLPVVSLPATLLISPLCLLFISIGILHVFFSFFIPFSFLYTKFILHGLYILIIKILNYFSAFPVIQFDYLPVALLSAIMILFAAISIIVLTTFILSRRAPNAAFARL